MNIVDALSLWWNNKRYFKIEERIDYNGVSRFTAFEWKMGGWWIVESFSTKAAAQNSISAMCSADYYTIDNNGAL
jgi:hypothetical protein